MTKVTADTDMIKSSLTRTLQKSPRLYRVARKVYSLFALRARVIPLSGNSLPGGILAQLRSEPGYHGIIDDLVAYTGFSAEELAPYLLRHPEKHFQSEFEWFSPKNERELTWFYRAGSAYLFGNAVHPYAPVLDIITEGAVLDFGAGAGCNTIGLAKRGIRVDFLEINTLQADFIRFRAERHHLEYVREVRPYHDRVFDPLSCITERYDAIIAMDVLEHIPDYHRFVAHFIERLNPGGLIIENSPFDPEAGDIAIHLRPSIPLKEAMAGMERMERGIWRKPPVSQTG